MCEILLVEDNEGDVRLTIEAFKDCHVWDNLHTVEDGEAALAFLRREGPYAHVPRPDIILLDLNLPKKDGREVLKEIKTDEKLKSIPVVVLTVSDAEEDINKAYSLHANCYICKPIELDQFTKIIRYIEEFWLDIVKLPSG
ncbi:MAG: response regulator [bacterium]